MTHAGLPSGVPERTDIVRTISRATNRVICVKQFTRDELIILHERTDQVGLGFEIIGKPLC